jgi:hypothetical protein
MAVVASDFGLALLGRANQELSGRQISIGLGIANGAWLGLIAGCAVVIADALRNRSVKSQNNVILCTLCAQTGIHISRLHRRMRSST